jgi:hypothetical protein
MSPGVGIISIYLDHQKYKSKLKQLNLPSYSFRISGKEGSEMIFDPLRKRWVKLTPEECETEFRQYLIHEGRYPAGLMAIEILSIIII